jgi:hypothetical protein
LFQFGVTNRNLVRRIGHVRSTRNRYDGIRRVIEDGARGWTRDRSALVVACSAPEDNDSHEDDFTTLGELHFHDS